MAAPYWIGTTNAYATNSNWSPATAAATGDTAVFDGRAIGPLAGVDVSGTVTLAKLIQYTKMAYAIGSAGTALKIGATLVDLGFPAPDGSQATPAEVSLDFSSIQNTTVVYSSASSGTSGLAPVLLKGTHASNKLTVVGGIVAVAGDIPGAVATYATVNIVGDTAKVLLESGCTLTTINQDAGYFLLKAAATTITQKGGVGEVIGTGAITTINANGTVKHKGTGTITNLNVQDGGVADFSGTFDALTVTNCNAYGSARIIDPNKRVTFTNGVIGVQGWNARQLEIIAPVTLTVA